MPPLIRLFILLFFITTKSLFAQVNCGATAPIILNQTHPSPIPLNHATPNPSGWLTQSSANLPNMGYLITLVGARDSSFNDNIVIGADDDGIFVPSDITKYGLTPSAGSYIEIVPFACNLSEMRSFVHFTTTFLISGTSNSCCALFNLQPSTIGLCDSLNLYGLADTNNITGAAAFIDFFRFIEHQEPMSVKGFISRINNLNNFNSTFTSAGCGSSTMCYAIDSSSRYTFQVSNIAFDTVLNVQACYSYESPSGNYTWTSTGSYIDTIPDTMGGDSIIFINLSVTSIDTAITVHGFLSYVSIITHDPSNTYQWMDCSTGTLVPLSGETATALHPTVNGSYSVEISRNGCVAMSECYTTNFGNCSAFSATYTVSQNPNNPFELLIQPIIYGGSSPNNTIELIFDFGDGNFAILGPLDTLSYSYSSYGAFATCMNVTDSTMGCVSYFCDTIGVDSTGMLLRGQSGFSVGVQPVLFNPTAVRYEGSLLPNKNSLQVFPNPNNGVFSIKLPNFQEETGILQLFDLNGRLLHSQKLTQMQIQEGVIPDNITPLNSGSYYLRLVSDNALYTQKVVIDYR